MKLLGNIAFGSTLGAAMAVNILSVAPASALTYSYADVTGWDTLDLDTPTLYSWKGINDLTVTRISPPGAGIELSTTTLSFPSTNPSNPEWIAGDRDFFQVAYDSDLEFEDYVSYSWNFANPLSPKDYLVFADFDFGEEILVDAYDANDNLIPFSAFTFAQENGLDPNGSTYTNVEFLDGVDFNSSVHLRSPDLDSASNPIVTLQSSIAISRLEYYFYMDDQGLDVGSNSIRINFATPVPESSSPFALLAVGATGVFFWGRKRIKTNINCDN